MSKFSLNIAGLASLERNVRAFPDSLKQEIDREIQASAETVVRNAIRDAPVDEGELRRSITFDRIGDAFEIVAQTEYAAFVEFGTKSKYRAISGYNEIAATFRQKGGSFKDLFRAILNWVHRKGITGTYSVKTKRRTGSKVNQFAQDYSVAWAIAISIARKGINPHPFFFHNFENEKIKLIDRIEKVLEKAVSRISVIQPGQFGGSKQIITI